MQGFNMGRYVPPEYEGTTSANKLAGKNALGNRARKSGQGILTVRFEMPFPIWCNTCPKPTIIGQGVRFNAEKKKVGNYYSTPIFSFRMKHVACGGWIEIRTDPKNTAYAVTEGAKKRDTGEDKVHEGEIRIKTDEERERLQNDAFAALEVKVDDKRQAATDRTRIEELQRAKEKDWEDPYTTSRKLRKTFRADRKARDKNQALTENLKDRLSLGIHLLEETEEDRTRASLVEFGDFGQNSQNDDTKNKTIILKAQSKPLFITTEPTKSHSQSQSLPPPHTSTSASQKTKIRQKPKPPEIQRQKLQQALTENTRAALDPFLPGSVASASAVPLSIPGIKRKRERERDVGSREEVGVVGVDGSEKVGLIGGEGSEKTITAEAEGRERDSKRKIPPLVDYDSD